jgi:predicted unusual protein kinase regulating ubiquinone biosynthesis (AarF/ABC1/UbiB family)
MSMSELRNVDQRQIHQFAVEFRSLIYEMPFQLPHNLLLLGRTVAILSGMCFGLDPDFNLWAQIAPYARNLMAAEGSSSWDVWLNQLGDLARELIALPSQTGRVLTRMERGELSVNTPQVNRQLYHIESTLNRLVASVIFSAFLLGGVLLHRDGDTTLAYGFWGLSGMSLLWMMFFSRGHSPWR